MLDGLVLSRSQRDSLERATAMYQANVDQAASYLVGRGIDQAGATSHRLGVVCEPALPDHERFVGWLAIPYLSAGGVVAIKFRRLVDGPGPKYDAPSGQKARLYNSRVLADGGAVVAVCEGELDALVCTSVVGVPAVGTPGTTWLEHFPRCFGDYDRVVVVADHDIKEDGSTPGQKHARKVKDSIPGAGLVTPPPGLDLGEWVLEYGAGTVRRAILG